MEGIRSPLDCRFALGSPEINMYWYIGISSSKKCPGRAKSGCQLVAVEGVGRPSCLIGIWANEHEHLHPAEGGLSFTLWILFIGRVKLQEE